MQSLIHSFLANFERLRSFEFSLNNPVFWVVAVVLFLLLLKFWNPRKSFYFCFMIATSLLATTYVENFFARALLEHGESFDPFFIRMISTFFISIVFIYFILVKPDS